MKKIVIIFSFNFLIGFAYSQAVYPSNTFMKTCYEDVTCFANQNSTFLYYNEANREFNLVIDFSRFKLDVDTLDAWLDDLDDTKLVFKSTLSNDGWQALSNLGHKSISLDGFITFNNVTRHQKIDMNIFEISTQGPLYENKGNDQFDKIRANIEFAIDPKDYQLQKKPHHLKKTISFNVGTGYINKFVPGMEPLIQN